MTDSYSREIRETDSYLREREIREKIFSPSASWKDTWMENESGQCPLSFSIHVSLWTSESIIGKEVKR